MKTKFVNALDDLLAMDPKESLMLTGKEVARKYDCATTCANYVIQALKYILSYR